MHDDLDLARASLLGSLLQRVGYALWQAAECEDTLTHYVVIKLRASRGVGEAAGNELMEKAQKRTLGHLLQELREKGALKVGLEGRLQVLLEERNWLVHRAKREHRGVLNDMSQLDKLVERLDRLAEEATNLNSLLGSELEEYVVTSGVDRQFIDVEASKLLRAWGYESGAAASDPKA